MATCTSRPPASPAQVEVHALLERALRVMDHLVPALDDLHERERLTSALAGHRHELAAAGDAAALAQVAIGSFDTGDTIAHAVRGEGAESRVELRQAIDSVRHALALLVQDGAALSCDVKAAADRFTSLLEIRDIRQLKVRLATEVAEFHRVALERQRHWRDAGHAFQARIDGLEREILRTKEEANRDVLTGVANRRQFEMALREAMAVPSPQLVVAIFDLDGFKQVNDTGGHAAGDELLKSVAATIKSVVRPRDLVVRLGGDEFTVLCVGLPAAIAESRMQAVLNALARIETGVAAPAHVSASCGIAGWQAADTVEGLMTRADRALYAAKGRGKGCVSTAQAA